MRISRRLALAFIVLAPSLMLADPQTESVTGSFYVVVDNSADIYVNGAKVKMEKGPRFEHKSSEMVLSVGDRVMVAVSNWGGPKKFQIVFVSSDKKDIISFRRSDWRIANTPVDSSYDFDLETFRKWSRTPKLTREANAFSFKHHSDPIWGDADRFLAACFISKSMIAIMPK